MRGRKVMAVLRAASLVAVLIAAQTTLLTHADVDEAHPAGEICAICVGLASVGAANVAAPCHVAVVVQCAERTDYAVDRPSRRDTEHRFARGPPRAS